MAKRTKSAIKRAEIADRNRKRNVAVKSEVKTRFRKVREQALDTSSGPVPDQLIREAISTIDVAVRKGVMHPNTAARRKSRLMKLVNQNAR
ncbi:MAG: 30S ribosomal protein S20 [Candidatus Sericytochromatia bacterium]|nr:30S ribosomal protein S20 [Candidatus Sericytochromatia bacterium]